MLPDTGIDDVKKQRNAEYSKHINDPVLSSLKMEGIRLLFFFFFLSCKANARVKLTKTGHGPHFTTLVCICVVRLFYVVFVCKCVLPPGDNPVAVNKYITSYQTQLLC
jgi:hypothetical protein